MKNNRFCRFSPTAQVIFLLGLTAVTAFAQDGDLSGTLAPVKTLGSSILSIGIALAGFAFVGLIIWGSLTLSVNRPRGLAMIGGGAVGALLAGLAFLIVNHLTGGNTAVGMLLAPLTMRVC